MKYRTENRLDNTAAGCALLTIVASLVLSLVAVGVGVWAVIVLVQWVTSK